MLVNASQVEQKDLDIKVRETWNNSKYKYFYYNNYYSNLEIKKDTWSNLQFISINAATKEVMGYIDFDLDRGSDTIEGVSLISFTDNFLLFGLDFSRALNKVITETAFRKISFSVMVGNPAERQYDKIIKRYNGEIVGIRKKHRKIPTGEICDVKLYEIDLIEYRKKRKAEKNVQIL